jgi:ASPIC and UnbV/FG-GAP-like repeat
MAGFVTAVSSVAVGQQFQDVSTQVGLIAEAKKSWGNPIWGDINDDGFLDLIVPCHGLTMSGGPWVYLNNNGKTFTDIRTTSGISQAPELDSTDWHGFSFGDYDGDGNPDLYIAEGRHDTEPKRDLLFKCHGDGTFEYVSDVAGIEVSTNRGRCGFWFDYDNDGKLDLFVKNFDSVNRLYKNNGDGSFTLVADAAGLATATLGVGNGSICSFADYDNDGWMDVAITGDGQAEALYRNQGGTFVDVTAASGLTALPSGHGIAWGDYNNDGFLDLYIARVNTNGSSLPRLYRNNGNGTFTDVTEKAGLASAENTYCGVWGDYDNDGFLDLFVTNAGVDGQGAGNHNFLYHNTGDGRFTDVAAAEGVALQDNVAEHKVAAWGDYNNDGFLDLIIKDGVGDDRSHGRAAIGLHRLFKNNGNSNHFIKVKLVGVESNNDGIGARVVVTSGRMTSFRQNNGGGGGEYASQGNEPLHFGIGPATKARVKVIWPSGVVDIVSSVRANSTLRLVEGTTR